MQTKKFTKIFFISFSSALLLLIIYLSSPYSNNLRSHYSAIFQEEANKTIETNKEKSLRHLIIAQLLYPTDELQFKIGALYLKDGNKSVALREFNKIENSTTKDEALLTLLENADTSLVEKYLDKNTALAHSLYSKQVISIFSKNKTLDCSNDLPCKELEIKTRSIVDKSLNKYTNTALADVLYKEGFSKLAISKLEKNPQEEYRDYYKLLAKFYYEKELYNNSAIALNKSLKIDPYDYESRELLKKVQGKSIDDKIVVEKELLNSLLKDIKY